MYDGKYFWITIFIQQWHIKLIKKEKKKKDIYNVVM